MAAETESLQDRGPETKSDVGFGLLCLMAGVSILVGLAVVEGFARFIESPKIEKSKGRGYDPHPVLGWALRPGHHRVETAEFDLDWNVNAHNMNDRPVEESLGRSKLRIMAVGDSHTMATGVSQEDTWPNALEEVLFGGDLDQGTVYNMGVGGYNVGQYLLRYREAQELLDPQIVIIGFCLATDVVDHIPPRLGGFVYGGDKGRVYFDLDAEGELIEIDDLEGKAIVKKRVEPTLFKRTDLALLKGSALYRRLRRSKLAMWASMRMPGQPVWASANVSLKVDLDEGDQFRWNLAEAIVGQLADEIHAAGRVGVLVVIPYLPQAYDDVWAASFGSVGDTYDRYIAGERLEAISKRAGLTFVDTTHSFVEAGRRSDKWLHFPVDRHPTPEGHKLIADVVAAALAKNGLIAP